MSVNDVMSGCRTFIAENYLYMHPNLDLKDDDLFFELGIVDSMGAMELVSFVEDSYGIAVDDMEITVDNFGSLARLGAYVSGKRSRELVAA